MRARPADDTKRRRREWYAVISISIVRSTRMRPIRRSIGWGAKSANIFCALSVIER